jgi:hypothetical protein
VTVKSPPASGVETWSAILVAIIAALASIGAAIYTATALGQLAVKVEDAALQGQLQEAEHEHEGRLEDRRIRPASRELATAEPASSYTPGRLRDLCVSRLCLVVLSRAFGSICNGHPASEVVNNQCVTIF